MLTKDVLSRSFWALPKEEVLEMLETSMAGLMSEDVEERQKIFKKNVLPKRRRLTKFTILLRQFESPLIILLVIAAAITLFLQDYKDSVFIAIAVIANVLLGFYQENKAESVLAHLETYIRERIRVLRNGHDMEIEASELVPGDIIHLSQGDRVPADCRLVYVNDFVVDESILTGESLPVIKNIHPVNFKAAIADQLSLSFRGTLVVQGFANAVIVRTGEQTELGKIAKFVAKGEKEKTPLQQAVINFSLKASAILVSLTVLIFFGGLLAGKSPLEMFLLAVAIAVSAVPEGLPVAMTVILAVGVQRLAKRNGVIRKLLAAETLGSTSVILTDKTGTLTEAQIILSNISVFGEKNPDAAMALGHRVEREFVFKLAVLNSDVIVENPKDLPEQWKVIGRPLEAALVKAAAQEGILLPRVQKSAKIINYLPFTSSNKFSASIVEMEGRRILNMIGAPEVILKFSELSGSEEKSIKKEIDERAYGGERIIGHAFKELGSDEEPSLRQKKSFAGMTFSALLSFRDPVRRNVKEALERVSVAGVRTVIVTGDHQGTAEAVAKEVGLKISPENIINGTDLDDLSDEELKDRVKTLQIVSRVSPEGKVRIVQSFRAIGETVAMTGDGINDAASLKEANVGIAMGSGTDVAKDVSDLILLDNNFSTIVNAIEEGRRILENLRKVIIYLTSSVFDELFLLGGALLFGLALPINALQILFINFITDSFPAIALAFEDGIDYLSKEKPRKVHENLFDKEMRFLLLVIGVPTSILLFAIYFLLLKFGFDPATVRTFIFASFGSYSLFLIFSVRSLRKPIFYYNPFSNLYLLLGVLFGLGAIAAAIYWPLLQNLFGTVSLAGNWLLAVAAIGVINILAIEIGKFWIRKHNS